MGAMSRTVLLELLRLPDTDDDEIMRLSAQLRRSLDALEMADVRPVRSSGACTPGAKSGELIATGTIAVTAASLVLRQVFLLADTWLKNRPLRGIRVELDGRSIELGHASADQIERLVDVFLAEAEPSGGNGTNSDASPEPPRDQNAV
jgi:hypothetical protein